MFSNIIAKCVLVTITFFFININLVQANYCNVPCIHGFCKTPSGYCKCDPGFGGPSCDLQRPPIYIVRGQRTNHRQHIYYHNSRPLPTEPRTSRFKSTCLCQNGGVCDVKCKCAPGWTGDGCANRCQPGQFGQNCTQACECFNGANCDHVTGDCICEPGFMGDKCFDQCAFDKFGVNCTETCSCGNGAACDKATGRCFCTPGWIGIECNERQCPENKYGENCASTCDCDTNNTESCHPHDGKCECKPGYNTTNCRTIDIIDKHEASWDESFWIIFCIVFIVTFAGIILMTYFCYRRRVTNLRAEITHAAKYLAAECNHCDNLEYTLQSNDEMKASEKSHNATNLNEDRLSNSSIYEDPALCVQCATNYESSSHNLYQIIDDHLYDEIVKKTEISQSDSEYDHLDHSRPLQKFHPNYHRASISNMSTLNRQNRIEAPSSFGVIYEELQFFEQPIYSNASVSEANVTKQT